MRRSSSYVMAGGYLNIQAVFTAVVATDGWIRQILEGAIYLLISGLYDPDLKQADWILNDYQDNLYHTPPYGYVIRDV